MIFLILVHTASAVATYKSPYFREDYEYNNKPESRFDYPREPVSEPYISPYPMPDFLYEVDEEIIDSPAVRAQKHISESQKEDYRR